MDDKTRNELVNAGNELACLLIDYSRLAGMIDDGRMVSDREIRRARQRIGVASVLLRPEIVGEPITREKALVIARAVAR